MMRVCQRLKRVIVTPTVYPRFFEFLHVDITRQSHGLFALAKHLFFSPLSHSLLLHATLIKCVLLVVTVVHTNDLLC